VRQNQAEDVREFFAQQQATNSYSDLKSMTEALDAAAASELNDLVRGKVLAVGGVWDFFEWHPRVRSLTVLDLSIEMLGSYCPPGGTQIEGDLYTVDLPAESFDTVVFTLMLHHTPRGNWRECERRIDVALDRAKGWLRPGGRVVILEYCPHPAWYPAQRALLPVTRRFLARFGQPLVVMYTRHFYERRLNEHFFGTTAARVAPPDFDYWIWYPVFMSVRWLRVPFAVYPKLHIFKATKGAIER
jgi:hypothetical protein